MSEYNSKFTGSEIDNAVEKVYNTANGLYPNGSSLGDSLLKSHVVYNALRAVGATYRHTVEGGTFSLTIYTNCDRTVPTSLQDLMDEINQGGYTIYRIGGITADGSVILAVISDPFGDYNKFLCFSSENTLVLREVTASVFDGQISDSVTTYYPKLN